MKLRRFIFGFLFISLSGIGFAQNTQATQEKVQKAKKELNVQICSITENILSDFEQILPEANSLSGVQPDAFIGKLFPSVLPHLSVGINASVTPVKSDFLTNNVKQISSVVADMLAEVGATTGKTFAFDFPFPEQLPYPAASVSARVGGLVLPFDVGLWGITTGQIFHGKSIAGSPVFDFDYTAFGADVRYAVLEGLGVFPKISVGAGYQFVRQNIGIAFAKDVAIDFEDDDGNKYHGDGRMDSGFNLKVDTHTIFGQIQVSKTLLIVTPYLGLKALFTTSNSAYDWKYECSLNETKINALSDGASKSYTHSFSEVGIQTQIFGGLSLNLAIFQTSFNAAYNFSSKMFTGSLGMNLKL